MGKCHLKSNFIGPAVLRHIVQPVHWEALSQNVVLKHYIVILTHYIIIVFI